MTRVVDLWRAIDPEARMVSGSPAELQRAVRIAVRTRTAAPHLPEAGESHLLIVDAQLVRHGLDVFLAAVDEAGALPSGILVAAGESPADLDPASSRLPVFRSAHPAATLLERATAYLADERAALARQSTELRLATAEAALADPTPAAPAGLLAARLRRGVAISADGDLVSLNPRPAGRALAARFAATHARLLASSSSERRTPVRQSRDGLWLFGRPIRSGAWVWIFDDLPLAQVDEVGAEALTVTLRALLRRPGPTAGTRPADTATGEPDLADPFAETLLAVARANGRVAPAARALGVHRNTVLYRLRVARAAHGLDPRRAEDALRILHEAESGKN